MEREVYKMKIRLSKSLSQTLKNECDSLYRVVTRKKRKEELN